MESDMKPYNERLPLIDAAIEATDGDIERIKDYRKTDTYINYTVKLGYFSVDSQWAFCGDTVCTHEEFEQRAKELGYINGYKWGVEYETNGEKPELPDDVLVEVEAAWCEISKYTGLLGNQNWSSIEKFRIVDKRYKPKEQEMNNDWHEKWELPPVGAKAKLRIDDKMQEVEVVAYHGSGEHKRAWVYSVGRGYRTVLPDSLRPLRTETDKLVEQMERSFEATGCVFTNDHKALAEHLIEQGFRKIKPMSEDEFIDASELDHDTGLLLYRAGCRFLDQGE